MAETTICQLLHGMTVGGAEILADRLARRLADRFRFVFACLDSQGELGESLQRDGFPVHVLGRGSGLDWSCARRLRKLLRTDRVDLVHCHQYTPFFYAMLSRMGGRRPRILLTEHGRFHPDYPRPKRILFNRLMLRRSDRAVAVGESVRQALISNEGLPAARVQVIYNGIDLSRFCRKNDNHAVAARAALGLNAQNFVVMQVARLDSIKDHLTAVRVAERCCSRIPNFRLLIVGEGSERGCIEAEIAARGVADRVRLLGTRHDVPQLLQAADACLLTSLSEGIPLTLIEAMAAGLPIVATRVGGVTETVEADETALLAPAGDDGGLASALERLAADPALRSKMGVRGRERAAALFSEETMHGSYRELFEEMCGHGTDELTARSRRRGVALGETP